MVRLSYVAAFDQLNVASHRRLLLLPILQFPLNPRVGNQPEKRHEDVKSGGNPWTDKGDGDSGEIKHKGKLTLSFPANGLRNKGVTTFIGDDNTFQDIIGGSCHQ